MKVTVLGTGTSVGVPAIGCDCPVCTSTNPRNRRRRCSLYIEAGGVHVVVDTPPDFREQALEYRIPRVDAVLFTHSHADHVFGFDDIRRFNTIQDAIIPAYGSHETIADLKRVFKYVQQERIPGMYRPRVDFRAVSDPFEIGALRIEPLQVDHGPHHTYGYLFACHERSLGYVPDCSGMEDDVVARFKGVQVMILDALRHRPHASHLTLENSLKLLQRIGAGRSYITHMTHEMEHEETQRDMPEWADVSYDGLVLEW